MNFERRNNGSSVTQRDEILQQGGMSDIHGFFVKFAAIMLMAAVGLPVSEPVSAQGAGARLEEVVVTAQRREQSLQEVPVSIQVFTGDALVREGFRNMDDLSKFSPSINIFNSQREQSITIRGMGTTGNNMGFEQAAPFFLDGVHIGRSTMMRGAFLDLERVEVLRGPQPVFFGQNASAGAFSLVSRKPGPEWEGDVTAEMGNHGNRSIEGGFGGPVTDTLGIRLAGKYDTTNGYMKDIWTNDPFPNGEDKTFRATLQWIPTENFEATLSMQYLDHNQGAYGASICEVDNYFALEGQRYSYRSSARIQREFWQTSTASNKVLYQRWL